MAGENDIKAVERIFSYLKSYLFHQSIVCSLYRPRGKSLCDSYLLQKQKHKMKRKSCRGRLQHDRDASFWTLIIPKHHY